MSGLIQFPCGECGGDGGFSYPASMDPFTGNIREGWDQCRSCWGSGIEEIETYPIELSDLDKMNTWIGSA
jgi:hypothetical protein